MSPTAPAMRDAAPTDLFADESTLPDDERGGPDADAPPPTLRTMPWAEARKKLWAMWDAQEPSASHRNASTEVNRRRRRGDRYVALVKSQDRNEWRVYSPPQTTRTPPSLNKSARLCRRVAQTVFADPPIPEATPASDSDEDRSAAEFTTRWLQAYGSDAGVNVARTAYRALNLASTFRSVFRHWYVDPRGGGQVAETILADPTAERAEEATHRRVVTPETDPTTGAPVVGADGQPVTREDWLEQPGPFVTRYVRPDGTLTDTEAEAARRWIPKIRCDLLTSRHVRLVPELCSGIDEAEGALIVLPVTLAALKRQFPALAEQLTGDEGEGRARKLVEWRPAHHRYLVPPHVTDEQLGGTSAGNSRRVPDDALVFVLTAYVLPTPDDPDGAHLVCAGGPDSGLEAYRGPWRAIAEGRRIDLDLPLDQWRQFHEGDSDPMGFGLMDLLGSGDELLQAQLGAWIEHLDRFNNRKTFVPHSSSFQPQQGGMPMGSYVAISGGTPVVEDVPAYPAGAVQFTEFLRDELNDESGLQEAGQGLDSPNVQSGFHASLVMERVQVALAEVHQNSRDALLRGWRIMLQLARAYFPDAQQLKTLGDDQTFKFFEWKSADFRATTDVQLARASFTMMTPTQKAFVGQSLFQAGLLTGEQMERLVSGNIGGLLALQDDPFRLEIRRQIDQWSRGPEANGDTSPFAPEPHHDEPAIAAVRHQELSRLLASTRSHRWPAPWRDHLVAAYEQARDAAAALGQPPMPGAAATDASPTPPADPAAQAAAPPPEANAPALPPLDALPV